MTEEQKQEEEKDDFQYYDELGLDDYQEYEELFRVVGLYKRGEVTRDALKEKLFELINKNVTNPRKKIKVSSIKKNFIKACEKMGVEPEKVLVIGDSLFDDIHGGRKNKMKTMLVKTVEEDER